MKVTVDKALIEQLIDTAERLQIWVGGLGKAVLREIDTDALRAALAEPAKAPGMAVQALAGEIIAALLADEKDGGYDLTAGLFGPAFSALVRRWAAAEWNSPPAEVPMLSDDEIWDIWNGKMGVDEMNQQEAFKFAGFIQAAVRRKAGL